MIYIGVRLSGRYEEEMLRRAALGRSKAEICRSALEQYFELAKEGGA